MRSRLDEDGYDRNAKNYQEQVEKAVKGNWGAKNVQFMGKGLK